MKTMRLAYWGSANSDAANCCLCGEPVHTWDDDLAYLLPLRDYKATKPEVDWNSDVVCAVCKSCFQKHPAP